MLSKITDYFRYRKIKTFTYFIPSPPARKTGYREKGFDQHIEELTSLGFEILDIKASPISSSEISGMWIIVTLRSTNRASFLSKPTDYPKEFESMGSLEVHENGNLHSKPNTSGELELPHGQSDELGEVYQID